LVKSDIYFIIDCPSVSVYPQVIAFSAAWWKSTGAKSNLKNETIKKGIYQKGRSVDDGHGPYVIILGQPKTITK